MKLGENDILKVYMVIIFTKFHDNWTKNVNFLLLANFECVSFFIPLTLSQNNIALHYDEFRIVDANAMSQYKFPKKQRVKLLKARYRLFFIFY